MSKTDPHVQLRNAVLDDHVFKGWMDADMFLAYCIMLRYCDWATGIWQGSADELVFRSGRQWSQRTAQRAMERLCDGCYITSGHLRGHRGNYPVFINNYVPSCGENKGKKLRRTKTRDWRSAVKSDDNRGGAEAKVTTEVPTKVSPKAPSPVASNQDVVVGKSAHGESNVTSNLSGGGQSVQADQNNNNSVVVVPDPPSDGGSDQEKQGLVAGYTPEEIEAQFQLVKDNPWVAANDSPGARKRKGYVEHLFSIDPPRKKPDGRPAYKTEGHQWL